jgi:hypothetical protein
LWRRSRAEFLRIYPYRSFLRTTSADRMLISRRRIIVVDRAVEVGIVGLIGTTSAQACSIGCPIRFRAISGYQWPTRKVE